MILRDYIFIDHKRLDSYVEQLSPEPKVVTIPQWQAEFSLTGPKISVNRTATCRSLTAHEKVEIVLSYLRRFTKEKGLRTIDPPYEYPEGTGPFVYGIIKAQRVLIPLKDEFARGRGPLSLWISGLGNPTWGGVMHALWRGICLIEDYAPGDADPQKWRFSSFSALVAMFAECSESLQETALSITPGLQRIMDKKAPNERTMAIFWNADLEYCAPDPRELLEEMGAKVLAGTRRLEILFRVRHESSWQMFGYPIFIADADSYAEKT